MVWPNHVLSQPILLCLGSELSFSLVLLYVQLPLDFLTPVHPLLLTTVNPSCVPTTQIDQRCGCFLLPVSSALASDQPLLAQVALSQYTCSNQTPLWNPLSLRNSHHLHSASRSTPYVQLDHTNVSPSMSRDSGPCYLPSSESL